MKRFDNKGMLIIPSVEGKKEIVRKTLVVHQCFCPEGHNLVQERAKFNDFSGIIFKAKKGKKTGMVAISPVFGDKSRISIDVDLIPGAELELLCPICDAILPVYSTCSCGGKIIALFTTPTATFSDCIGVCNKVDCVHSFIKDENELITHTMFDVM